MSEIEKIKLEFLNKLDICKDVDNLKNIKKNLFGKSGLITSQFKLIG